ncbi:murein biosynthesis integral membrane protein MurJ [Caldinitratiruptor microaerophilus]|uniref:Peptidoglycan lipid II flippase n=1 Tax=Caldinitratiruptor microaerophilus TaxID=671077 RepID=A0AA35CKC0_9FIRM|nr:lipid II flippase MurJ [Caldinitratiruptor microaerophilus]BDG60099.1 hypothetical protein caldi_11890 [Caldinitratiruptor microaerophilus]
MRQRGLLGAAALVTVFTVVQKLAGFVREQAVARAFGASAATDVYLVGMTLPELATVVAAGGVLGALVPDLAARVGRGDRAGAWVAARRALARTAALGGGAALVVFVALPLLLAPFTHAWPSAEARLAVNTARIAIAGPVLVAVASVLAALLHAHRVFVYTPLGRSAQSLLIAAVAFALAGAGGPLPLAWAYLAGAVVQVGLLATIAALALRRPGGRGEASPPEAGADGAETVPGGGALFAPVAAWSLLQSGYLVVDRLFAPVLPPGAIAALTFSDKLRQFALQTAVWAVGAVSYPALAAARGSGDGAALQRVLGQGMRLALLVALPVTAGLLTLRLPIVQVVYQRGAFGPEATRLTAATLLGDAVGVTGFAVTQLLAYVLFTLGRPWVPPLALLAGAGVQALIGALLLGPLGAPALAWGASMGAFAAAGVQAWAARREVGDLVGPLVRGLARPALAAAAMGAACLVAAPRLGGLPAPQKAIATLVLVGAAALLYGLLLWWLGVPEVAAAVRRLVHGRDPRPGPR